MNKMKTLVLGTVLAASTVASSVAMAESPWVGNLGVTSNYIWRGVTQTADQSAVSGGIDYTNESGAYFGTWVSNLSPGQYEQDVYLGYGFEAGSVGLDVGYIMYMYPVADVELDFEELYVDAGYENFAAGIAFTTGKEGDQGDESDMYMYVSADFEIKKDLTLGLTVGNYDFDDAAAEDYTHYQVSVSKDDFTFALDKNNITDSGAGEDDMRFTVSWAKSFDL